MSFERLTLSARRDVWPLNTVEIECFRRSSVRVVSEGLISARIESIDATDHFVDHPNVEVELVDVVSPTIGSVIDRRNVDEVFEVEILQFPLYCPP